MNITKLFCFLLLLAVSMPAAETKPENLKPADFETVLRKIAQDGNAVITSPPSAVDFAVWQSEARALEPDVSLPAVFKLVLAGGQGDFIQLVWWENRNRAAAGRMLVVALYECTTDEPTSAKPSFEIFASRFDEGEEKARKAEITFVESHRRELAKQLVQILEATDAKLRSEEANELLGHYKRMAAKP